MGEFPGISGGFSNTGTMPITGGQAGPSTATSTTSAGQRVGSMTFGGSNSTPWLVIALVVAVVLLMKKK